MNVRVLKKLTSLGVDSEGDSGSRRKHGGKSVARFSVRELGSPTWPDFERMVEKHNGVWGGCWCTFFHLAPSEAKQWSGKHKEYKEKLVRANRSHAALVYDGADVVGWCQFGPLVELPGRMSGYGKMDVAPPEWRITCFFVDRDHRKAGVAKAALEGALGLISARGGGTVDGYPKALPRGKPYSSSFIWGRNPVNVHRARIPSARVSWHKQPGDGDAKSRSQSMTSSPQVEKLFD